MSPNDYPIPAWKVVMDGQDLTDRIAPRLLDLTLTERRGGEADQLDLRIHDHDGRLALPKRGVALAVSIGWHDDGMIDKGRYRVDEVEHSGSPDIITVRARSADLTKKMRTRRERSWHDVTLGTVLRALGGEHSLKTQIAPALADIQLPHLDQTNESDVHLLTRLAKRFDAVATVKAGTLLFAAIGSGQTPSGLTLPQGKITRSSGDQHRWSLADRDTYTGVTAAWSDKRGARKRNVTVGDKKNAKRLKSCYSSEAEARQHAQAEWGRVRRGVAKFNVQLALGRADLYPEQRLSVEGFKPEIDGTQWLIAQTTHTITGNGGFTTQLEMETS